MKVRNGVMLSALLGAMAWTAATSAAERADFGRREFLNKCAACHGQSGRGDGGVAGALRIPPTDLTLLSKNNGGAFPEDRVYRVIDGRDAVRAHGTRDMPVWGNFLAAEGIGATRFNSDTPVDMRQEVRARIGSLIDYLKRIQAR